MSDRPIFLLTINLGLRILGLLQPGTSGAAYSATLTGYGGVEPYLWSLADSSPALPTGLSLTTDSSGDGIISGTPTASGYFYPIITVQDSTGRAVSRTLTLLIQ